MKVVVFDLGGTLMQYVGMPYSWEDFYYKGFEEIIREFRYPVSQEVVEKLHTSFLEWITIKCGNISRDN